MRTWGGAYAEAITCVYAIASPQYRADVTISRCRTAVTEHSNWLYSFFDKSDLRIVPILLKNVKHCVVSRREILKARRLVPWCLRPVMSLAALPRKSARWTRDLLNCFLN